MKNVKLELTPSEMYVGGLVGTLRRVISTQNGYDKNKHAEISDWQTDCDGACAEMAVAKFYRAYWTPTVNTFKSPDLPGRIQVRSTTYTDGCLIIRPNDKIKAEIFILVITKIPHMLLVGMMHCGDAKQKCHWLPQKKSWWVRQKYLLDLPESLEHA